MKLILSIVAILAMTCGLISATHVMCEIIIVRATTTPYEHFFRKNGNNIAGNCFGDYFEIINNQKAFCKFESQIIQTSQYDQANIQLKAVCKDEGGATYNVVQGFKEKGYMKYY